MRKTLVIASTTVTAIGTTFLYLNLQSNAPILQSELTPDTDLHIQEIVSLPPTKLNTDAITENTEQISRKAFLSSCFISSLLATDETLAEDDLTKADTLLFPEIITDSGRKFMLWDGARFQHVETDTLFYKDRAEFKVNIIGQRTPINYVSSLSKDGNESQSYITPQIELSMRINFDNAGNITSEIINPADTLNTTPNITNRINFDEQISGMVHATDTIQNTMSQCANPDAIAALPEPDNTEEVTDDFVETCIASSISYTKKETLFSDIEFYPSNNNNNKIEFQVNVQGKRVTVDVWNEEKRQTIRNVVSPSIKLTIQEPFTTVTLGNIHPALGNKILNNSANYFVQTHTVQSAAHTITDHLQSCIPKLQVAQ